MTTTKRKATDLEKKVLIFLNEVRETGEDNMFGVAPQIAFAFDMDKHEARKYLSLWMKNFNDEGNYDEIED